MDQQRTRLTWKFYICFLLWTSAISCFGYFLLWDEIKKIQDLIPESNRNGKDNCYDNPLLSFQIWTRECHFYPFYTMQSMVEYFGCLETDEALDAIRMFYITYNIGGIVLLMGFIAFILVISRYPWKYAIEVIALPTIFGIGEGVFISVLAGNFKDSDVGGLSEVNCELCSSVGVIFWVLLSFILIICIYGVTRQCCCCSRDRQKGIYSKTVRDKGSGIFLSERENGSGEKKNVKNDLF